MDDRGEGTSSNAASAAGPQPAGTDPKLWTVSEVRKQVQALVRRCGNNFLRHGKKRKCADIVCHCDSGFWP